MTRETKAGLVVSCSFLCLVGAVLYSKLTGPKPPPMDEYAAGPVEAPPAPTPVDENNPSEAILQLGSETVGSSSEKMAATTGSGTAKAPALPNKDLSTSQDKTGEDGPVVGDQTAAGQTASASKPENSSKGDKGASTSIYAIPDPVDDDKNPPSNRSEQRIRLPRQGPFWIRSRI